MPTAGGNDRDGLIQEVNLDEQDTHSQVSLLRASHNESIPAAQRIPLLFPNWWLWEIVSAGTAFLAIVVIIIIVSRAFAILHYWYVLLLSI